MLRRTIILCLVALMATAPALARVCATSCGMTQPQPTHSGPDVEAHSGAAEDCHGLAPSQHEPADSERSDTSVMAAACAVAACAAMPVLVTNLTFSGGSEPAIFCQTFPPSLTIPPPAEPPRL